MWPEHENESAEITLRPGPIANRLQDAILPYMANAGPVLSCVGFMPASYEQVPYPGFPFEQTHPDRLATMATLSGVDAAPVECCRVLELGCGGGRNLIPMAFGLPYSPSPASTTTRLP